MIALSSMANIIMRFLIRYSSSIGYHNNIVSQNGSNNYTENSMKLRWKLHFVVQLGPVYCTVDQVDRVLAKSSQVVKTSTNR